MRSKKLLLFLLPALALVFLITTLLKDSSPISRLNKLYHLNLSKKTKVLQYKEQWELNGDGFIDGLFKLTNKDCKRFESNFEGLEENRKYFIKNIKTNTQSLKLFIVKSKNECYLHYVLSII